MKEEDSDELNLKEFYGKISFLSSLKEYEIPEWQKKIALEIWNLKHDRIADLKWTDANLTKIIKKLTQGYKDKITEQISDKEESEGL